MKRLNKLPATLLALALAATPLVAAEAPNAQLQPFKASYDVIYKGINAGTSELELTQVGKNWQYVSRTNARGFARLFFSDEITQTSLMEVDAKGLRPVRYRGDDGSDDTDKDISYDFDWNGNQVTGTAEDKPVKLALDGAAHDPMSIQLVLVLDLLRGREISSYRLVNKQEIKEYEYTLVGKQRIKTHIGEYDTLIYRSQRANNKRATLTWHAPALGYLPLKAERLKDGKREAVMEIKTLKR